MKGKQKGAHQWFIEFKNMPSKSINLENEYFNTKAKLFKTAVLNINQ